MRLALNRARVERVGDTGPAMFDKVAVGTRDGKFRVTQMGRVLYEVDVTEVTPRPGRQWQVVTSDGTLIVTRIAGGP